MNREDLYEAAGHIDEDILARSEGRRRPRRGRWLGVAAAVVALAMVGGVLLWPGGSPLVTTAYAVREAAYPETVAYPNEEDYLDPATGVLDDAFSEAYDAWWASRQARQQPAGYADSLAAFWEKCLPALLGGQEGENAVCSPLNLYLALGMLAELTAGDTRQQILDLLGAESLEALRTQARQVWQGHYWQDGISASTLASSLWLEEGLPFQEAPLDTLAEAYYASTYQADLGSEEGNQALQTWLRDQTGGLLEDQAGSVTLSPGHHPVFPGPVGPGVPQKHHPAGDLPRPGGGPDLRLPPQRLDGDLLLGRPLRRRGEGPGQRGDHVVPPPR